MHITESNRMCPLPQLFFKARGACNVLASMPISDKTRGCTISGGRNFVRAMTHYGYRHSVPVNVVVPKSCPSTERHRYKEDFAVVKVHGNDTNDASLHALSYVNQIGSNYIHGMDRLDLIAGYGTLGLELLTQLDKMDAVLCPVGSGSLVAGIVLAVKSLKPNCLIYRCAVRNVFAMNQQKLFINILAQRMSSGNSSAEQRSGVESVAAPTMSRAVQEKKPVMIQAQPSVADSLSAPIASNNAYNIVRGYLDKMIAVEEIWISRAMLFLLEQEKMVVEGAAACPVAALMAGKLPELRGKTVVCILTGGNISNSRMAAVIDRGMAAAGRLVSVNVAVADAPGALTRLLAKLTEAGADVKSITTERSWGKRDPFSLSVSVNMQHLNSISAVIDRGMAAARCLVSVNVAVSDGPGALGRLLAKLTEAGADVESMERSWANGAQISLSVNLVIETNDIKHAKDLEKKLMKDYPHARITSISNLNVA
ncbi:hypothetical protein MSG28_006864 [Choristoneura fumiferana]|uniref:Uncharacterized protein n=1 Tax=Choristoneura fumiferana TaxID=7141 RepID=A0ACC0JLK0_CHOFU|nr:hypothetical protein MSG28_006864 [Choristoneura fumiferana]